MSRASQGRAVLSWVLSLPAPVLRLLSGGAATYREGRTLDPRLQFLAAGARRGRPMSAMTPEEARAWRPRTATLAERNRRIVRLDNPEAPADLLATFLR